MSEDQNELLELLDLQSVDDGVFMGPPSPSVRSRVFGGQFLGQALAAACFTVEDWSCHSLHAYFVRPGIVGRPTQYEVSAFNNGKSFCTRQVVAVQRDEVAFQLVASFQADQGGFEYQGQMPEVQLPESFPDEQTRRAAALEKASEAQRDLATWRWPVEMIPLESADKTTRRFWVRGRGQLPADPNLQRCVLAYASDLGALSVCMQAMDVAFGDPGLEIASLDHALWFHRDFRSDDWLLFDQQAVSVGKGRALSKGRVFDREGRLIASMAQEGVMRRHTAG